MKTRLFCNLYAILKNLIANILFLLSQDAPRCNGPAMAQSIQQIVLYIRGVRMPPVHLNVTLGIKWKDHVLGDAHHKEDGLGET